MRVRIKTAIAGNDDLRQSFDAYTGMAGTHAAAAREFGVSDEEASRAHYAIVYFFWLHWGQYSSSMDEADREELAHLIGTWYGTPPIKHQWLNSPIAKPIIDERFVKFVDGILDQHHRER